MSKPRDAEVIIIGGGLAGLSAAIYLGRARREALVVDAGKSLARWEPEVQNYLGFPNGVRGTELLDYGRRQAVRYGIRWRRDTIVKARVRKKRFVLRGERDSYSCDRLLLATGLFHLPPDLPGMRPCLGHSMFFCKDCDGYRVQGKTTCVYGWTNQAVEYALSLLLYSPRVLIVTDGRPPRWDRPHARWVREYEVPVYPQPIVGVRRAGRQLRGLGLKDGTEVVVDALFTTRGDIYFNQLAIALGAKVDAQGEVLVDLDMRTSVKGLYAAGCVTPVNCQMIIAAGHGAIAAQAINRDLFEESLATHSLRRFRDRQLQREQTRPAIRKRARLSLRHYSPSTYTDGHAEKTPGNSARFRVP